MTLKMSFQKNTCLHCKVLHHKQAKKGLCGTYLHSTDLRCTNHVSKNCVVNITYLSQCTADFLPWCQPSVQEPVLWILHHGMEAFMELQHHGRDACSGRTTVSLWNDTGASLLYCRSPNSFFNQQESIWATPFLNFFSGVGDWVLSPIIVGTTYDPNVAPANYI